MVSATRSAASGLRAATATVAAAASNLANARTTSRPEDVVAVQPSDGAGATRRDARDFDGYQPLRVEQESLGGGGVRARYGAITPSHVLAYDPSDPNADAEGLVARPNVDPTRELLNLGIAQRAYEASLKVIETEDEMSGSLLDALK